MTWPRQSEVDAYYGNPRGRDGKVSQKWMAKNLVAIRPPFLLYFLGKPVRSVRIHRRCAESLLRVFNCIWIAAQQSQARIDEWGVSTLGGTFNYRPKRKSNSLSMHAYGCAIDLAPLRYPMGSSAAQFCDEVMQAFSDEAWVNLPNDRMHFQAAIL